MGNFQSDSSERVTPYMQALLDAGKVLFEDVKIKHVYKVHGTGLKVPFSVKPYEETNDRCHVSISGNFSPGNKMPIVFECLPLKSPTCTIIILGDVKNFELSEEDKTKPEWQSFEKAFQNYSNACAL